MLQRLLLALFTLVVFALPADAAKRVALVIGNAKYTHFSALANPDNDATSIAQALRDAKFDDVELASDLDFNGLKKALKNFSAKAVGSEVALVYYAGHGVEVDGINYLVPVEAELQRATDVEFEAIPLDLARTSVSSATKLRMVVLDACRNNPFKLVKADGTRAGRTRGLRAIETKASEFIAYSAKEGTTANDGPEDGNSPFAAALVSAIAKPGLEVRLLFGKVRDDVMEATNKEQEPFTYTSLGGESIFLNPAPPVPEVSAKANLPDETDTAVRADTAPAGPTAIEIDAAWQAVKLSNNKQALEGFVALYEKDRLYQLYGPLVQQLLKNLDTKPVATAAVEKPADKPVALASLEPPKIDIPAPPMPEVPKEQPEVPTTQTKFDPILISAVQSELKRVACYNGRSDGKWGPAVLAATSKFNALTEPKLTGLEPTAELLTALQETADNFCIPVSTRNSATKSVDTPEPVVKTKKVKPAAKVVSVKPRAVVAPKVVAKPAPKKVVAPPKKVAAKPKPVQQKAAAKPRPAVNRPTICTGLSIGRITATPCF
jgi:Caspase domain